MTLLVQNNGEVVALGCLVNKTTPENLVYRLFTNSVTPSETDTAATYTEATGGGYAAATLSGASWTITPGAPSSAAYPQQTYTFTGPLTTNPDIRGYYVTRATSGDLVLSETFTVFTPTNNGDNIKLTPTITAD